MMCVLLAAVLSASASEPCSMPVYVYVQEAAGRGQEGREEIPL